MYALSESFLEYVGEYQVEMYEMEIFGHNDIGIDINLKIFGEGKHKGFIGDYLITRADGKITTGSCLNRQTKEATIEAIEEKVIEVIRNPDRLKWE